MLDKLLADAEGNGLKDAQLQTLNNLTGELSDIFLGRLGSDPPVKIQPVTVKI